MKRAYASTHGSRGSGRSFFDLGEETAGKWIAKRITALVGTALVAYALAVWGLDVWARTWPTTPGIVLESGVRTEEAWFQGKHRVGSPRMVHVPWMRYRYEWKGDVREGRRQYVSDLFISQNLLESARAEVNGFPRDREIAVRVCPLFDAWTVVKTRGVDGVLVPLVAGTMLLLIAGTIHFCVSR